ncbi:MAG: ATP-binding protein [bacterium]|nr:ATP-binding protein [bacterium]
MSLELVPQSAVIAMLRRVNPWWSGKPIPGVPETPRDALASVTEQISDASTSSALMLEGPRGVGKTTMLLQAARKILFDGVAPEQVVYASFDHPVFRAAGLAAVVDAWRNLTPKPATSVYFLLDEVQYVEDWDAWLAKRPDLPGTVHVLGARSARPKAPAGGEEAWQTIQLTTLTIREYLAEVVADPPDMPELDSLRALTRWKSVDFERAAAQAEPALAYFNDLMICGGLPETLGITSVEETQQVLRERVVERALKCDLTSLYGVRRIAELERLFLLLCMQDASVLDMQEVSRLLGISKNTARSHLDLLEAANLIYRLPQFGYGTEVLRGKEKVFVRDPAIALSVLMLGHDVLEDTARTAAAAESCVFKHLAARYPAGGPTFSYWRGKPGEEVSVVATGSAQSRPFMVRYADGPPDQAALKGLRRFCKDKDVKLAYVITKRLQDFGPIPLEDPDRGVSDELPTRCVMVPALLFCYWMSQSNGSEEPKKKAGWFRGLRK